MTNNLISAEELAMSQQIENLLVSRNPRGMQLMQTALVPGYYARASKVLFEAKGVILIGTGFPVAGTFETDGPIGAMALYHCLENLGKTPFMVCAPPMADALLENYRVHVLAPGGRDKAEEVAAAAIKQLKPSVMVSIERPGQAVDGNYYNMRGEDISEHVAHFDQFFAQANCPTIGIGDGGNELGMGNIHNALLVLDITPSITLTDELLIADVSNWGAYGLIAMLSYWSGQDCFAKLDPKAYIEMLSRLGSVDGVTRENTLTEDGLPLEEGLSVVEELRAITGVI